VELLFIHFCCIFKSW